MRDNELFSPFDYELSCLRMACDPIVYTRTAIDFDSVSQCCPTGICHAYAPVLSRTLCALSGTASTCPDRMSFDRGCLYPRPSPCDRVRVAFLQGAVSPVRPQPSLAFHRVLARPSRNTIPAYYPKPGAHSCGVRLRGFAPPFGGLPCYGWLAYLPLGVPPTLSRFFPARHGVVSFRFFP